VDRYKPQLTAELFDALAIVLKGAQPSSHFEPWVKRFHDCWATADDAQVYKSTTTPAIWKL
jgi:hypothetical protein